MFDLRLIVVLLASWVTVKCVDRQKLYNLPKPDPYFDINSYAGDWYFQGRYLSCSFNGARKFSDMKITNTIKDGHVLQNSWWRVNKVCTNMNFKIVRQPKSLGGGMVLEDLFGGMLNGEVVVVLYNRKKGYDITQGCTRRAPTGKQCLDSWVAIKTRDRHPSVYLMKCIEKDLKRLYNMSFSEMTMVTHDNRMYTCNTSGLLFGHENVQKILAAQRENQQCAFETSMDPDQPMDLCSRINSYAVHYCLK